MSVVLQRKPTRVPGGVMMHPATLAATALLLANDHGWKESYPSWLSGKLSDVMWLFLLPLWLLSLAQLLMAARGRELSPPAGSKALLVSLSLCALCFTMLQLSASGGGALCTLLGVIQWPLRAAGCWLRGAGWPSLQPVQNTADPSDLLALPALLPSYWLGRTALRAQGRKDQGATQDSATDGYSP